MLSARSAQVAEPKQEETFKVVDRRLVTEDGQLRKDVVEQERRDEEAAQNAASKPPSADNAGANARESARRWNGCGSARRGQCSFERLRDARRFPHEECCGDAGRRSRPTNRPGVS